MTNCKCISGLIYLAGLIFLFVITSQEFFGLRGGGVPYGAGFVEFCLVLLVFYIFAPSFDEIKFGKVIELRSKVQEVQEQNSKLEKRNNELLNIVNSLFVNSNSSNQKQSLTQNYFLTDKAPGVIDAAPKEVEAQKKEEKPEGVDAPPKDADVPKKEEKCEEAESAKEGSQEAATSKSDKSQGTFVTPSKPLVGFKEWLNTRNQIEAAILKNEFSGQVIKRQVKFNSALDEMDPIMKGRPIIFDGYFQSPNEEIFIEVTSQRYNSQLFDRLYLILSKINEYRKAKNIKASLLLIIYPEPLRQTEHSGSDRMSSDRLYKEFSPAVESGLLTIKEYTDFGLKLILDSPPSSA